MNTLLERFSTRYNVDANGCWIWTGAARSKFGYGQISIGHSGNLSAHRAAYLLLRGDIPPGMCVLHRCDVPACVNPDHLFLGTKRDNNEDRDRKGRYRNGRTKLNAIQKKEILDSPDSSPVMAKRLGVTRGRVEQIRRAAGQVRGRANRS